MNTGACDDTRSEIGDSEVKRFRLNNNYYKNVLRVFIPSQYRRLENE